MILFRKEVDRFNLSKRRLANMMGEDPNTFGEDDVKVGSFLDRDKYCYIYLLRKFYAECCDSSFKYE